MSHGFPRSACSHARNPLASASSREACKLKETDPWLPLAMGLRSCYNQGHTALEDEKTSAMAQSPA